MLIMMAFTLSPSNSASLQVFTFYAIDRPMCVAGAMNRNPFPSTRPYSTYLVPYCTEVHSPKMLIIISVSLTVKFECQFWTIVSLQTMSDFMPFSTADKLTASPSSKNEGRLSGLEGNTISFDFLKGQTLSLF